MKKYSASAPAITKYMIDPLDGIRDAKFLPRKIPLKTADSPSIMVCSYFLGIAQTQVGIK